MRRLILITEPDTKRINYFLKAAEGQNQEVEFFDINKIFEKPAGYFNDSIIKVDPPSFKTEKIDNINLYMELYKKLSVYFSGTKNTIFLNEPKAILTFLDKRKTKEILMSNNISCTPLILGDVGSLKSLKRAMEQQKVSSVFIKPRFGSGAAGVTAYRYNVKTGDEIAFTSAYQDDRKHWINTKRITKYTNKEDINSLLDTLFSKEVIVEKWIPKDNFGKDGYDLRVVWQFGHIAFIVGRCGDVITNLHLNNKVISLSELMLDEIKLNEIEDLCNKAMSCFTGTSIAGIDILLSKGSKKPYIIEINGQGDLIYKDINNENTIYNEQVMEMEKLKYEQ